MTLALSITDLHKSFNENEVIKGMSLEANKGDVISLIGASGSGKSTFLRCINLLETPNSGEVRLNGELMEMKTDSKVSLRACHKDRKQGPIGFIITKMT